MTPRRPATQPDAIAPPPASPPPTKTAWTRSDWIALAAVAITLLGAIAGTYGRLVTVETKVDLILTAFHLAPAQAGGNVAKVQQ